MNVVSNREIEIPERILEKFSNCESSAFQILEVAQQFVTDFDTSTIRFIYESKSPLPLMTTSEKSRSLAFIVRYQNLPVLTEFVIGLQPETGLYYLNEIDQVRAALNEYRTIFFNQRDGIYFGKVTKQYQKALKPTGDNPPLAIKVLSQDEEDVSGQYLTHLISRKKAIVHAIEKSDFDYIFNGVLQHADDRYSRKMVEEYVDGSLTYVLYKNLLIAHGIQDLLREHYVLINALNFPRMGPL